MFEGTGQSQRSCANCGTEIRPTDKFCRSCGKPVRSDEASDSPGSQGQALGLSGKEFDLSDPIGSFLATVRDLVIKPVTFFRGMPRRGNLVAPVLFAFVCILVWTTLTALVGLSFSLAGGIQGAGSALGVFLLSVIFYPLLALVGLFVGAGIYHLLIVLLAGQQRHGYETTLRVYAYTSVALLIAWIPILGWVVAPIWSILLAIFGIREAHNTTTSKATLVVLILPGAALLLFLFLLMINLLFVLL